MFKNTNGPYKSTHAKRDNWNQKVYKSANDTRHNIMNKIMIEIGWIQ